MAESRSLPRRSLVAVALASLLPRTARADEPTAPSPAPAAPPAPGAPPAAPAPAPGGPPASSPSTPPVGEPAAERDRTVASTYTIPVEGTDLVIGGAAIDIHAPIEDVKRVLTAFHRYREILPRIQQSRVLAEKDDSTDVYLRAPILHGLAALWGVARFAPFAPWRKRGVQLVGTMVSGNLEKWSGKWLAFPCGEKRTLLKLELFVQVGMPLPTRVVTKWLLWACQKGVTAVRDMAECGKSSVSRD
ncbi:MAG: hypothetical protein FJ096_21650 [Deltaproteobacteria bacterium]|nr:hypothetical protein [Deltaproteobacteria bacterium]